MIKQLNRLATTPMALLLIAMASPAIAADRGDVANARLDARGERIDSRLDARSDRIDSRPDRRRG